MPESISDFIMKCWELDPKERPSMIEILNDFRNHHFLFPNTNLNEFDEYVERIFSVKVTSQFVKRALKNEKFSNSVKTLYNSISIAHNLNFNNDFLRTLYTIREQTESYSPLILNITRPGCDYKRFCAAIRKLK